MPHPTERHLSVYVDYRGEHPEVCISETKTGLPVAEGMRTHTVLDCVHIVNAMLRREVDPVVLERAVPDEPASDVWPS